MIAVKKEKHEIRLGRHLALFIVATPLVFGAGLAGLTAISPGASSGEVNTAAMIGTGVGLATGWLFGLAAWLLNWGLHGWVSVYRHTRDFIEEKKEAAALEAEVQAEVEAEQIEAIQQQVLSMANADEYAPATPISDPWDGMNPWGCCEEIDLDGKVRHGKPGCQHPEILNQIAWGERVESH